MVPKKDGNLTVVQDFRELNDNSLVNRYSIKEIIECIGALVFKGLPSSPPLTSHQDFGRCH
jgi:hypothetical protein